MNESGWTELMASIGFAANMETYQALLASYSEKHRHYHNVSHIQAVLGHLQQSRHLAADYHAIAIALWFHDAVYKVFSATNELDSADWAVKFLAENGASQAFSERVHALIMATVHDAAPSDNDEKLMVDIDLSILGSSPQTYALFESGVRKEYKLVPDFIYKKKRKAILSRFLERESIYSHEHFYQQLEASARANISKAIQNL
ncbi:hypothetical protein [Thalassomonas viridans]|nr:hypothetical protein [Thalassomonas viridans]